MASKGEKRNLDKNKEEEEDDLPPAKKQRTTAAIKDNKEKEKAKEKDKEKEKEKSKDTGSKAKATGKEKEKDKEKEKEKKEKENVKGKEKGKEKGKSKSNDENESEDIDIYSIIFLTGNQGKLKEVQSFFGEKIGKLISNQGLDLEETQGTPKEIITKKLLAARKVVGNKAAILVEDTSLVLNAYSPDNGKNDKSGNKSKEKSKEKSKDKSNDDSKEDETSDFLGFPGPFIKWLLKWDKDGNEGLCKMVRGLKDNSAFALCIFGFLPANSDKPLFFGGKCDGIIPDKPKGDKGFGWDPVFIPKENKNNEKSFAQMTTNEKNKISHRGKALVKFKQYLENVYLKDMK